MLHLQIPDSDHGATLPINLLHEKKEELWWRADQEPMTVQILRRKLYHEEE